MADRIAIVVQRMHESIVGGSEQLAWQYARMLAPYYEVELLTTTALDYVTWRNELKPGVELKDRVKIIRFYADFEREPYWNSLHLRMLDGFTRERNPTKHWRLALQEEFIRTQGPYSSALLTHLGVLQTSYRAVIFCTYLYPTSYFGMERVEPAKIVFAPTLHDEPPAYLPAYKYRAQLSSRTVWLTGAEQKLAGRLWGYSDGTVVGMAVNVPEVEPYFLGTPYILYSGRIDPSKGCKQLFDYFDQYRSERRNELKLLSTGRAVMPVPRRRDIVNMGFVDESTKYSLMRGARCFVMPSPYESFSIVTLEAMGQGTPVIVNAECEVLREHAEQSGVGFAYRDYTSFRDALDSVLGMPEVELCAQAERAIRYVRERYTETVVQKKLLTVLSD